jgi:hypothetical protein
MGGGNTVRLTLNNPTPMNSMISNGVPFDSAQGTPFIGLLGCYCALTRIALRVGDESKRNFSVILVSLEIITH